MPRPKSKATPRSGSMSKDETKDKIIQMFKQFDKNGDGFLDRDELLDVFQRLSGAHQPDVDQSVVNRECEMILDAADSNKDGRISVEEFVEWAYSWQDDVENHPEEVDEFEPQRRRLHLNHKTLLPQRFDVEFSKSYAMDRCQLGEGGYAKVFVAKDTEFGNRLVAVKRVTKTDEHETGELIYNEVEVMQHLDHPNICKLLGFYEEGMTAYFVMEYCQGGELFDKILDLGTLSESIAIDIVRQIVSALRHAHGRSIAHRDLKPENVVFCSKDEKDTHLKLIDWGLGMSFADCRMCDPVGSTMYMAPEVSSSNNIKEYTQKCDMYSLGVLTYVSMTGREPFWGPARAMQVKQRAEKYPFTGPLFDTLSEHCRNFIQSLLRADPTKRPDVESLAAHPWLTPSTAEAPTICKSLGKGVMNNLKQFRGASSFSALCMSAVARQLDHTQLSDVHQVFKSMDKNGDGALSIEEIMTGFLALMGEDSPTYKEILETFKSLDLDGSNGIDYTEFCAGGLGQTAIAKDESCWGAFKAFDVDNNNVLSPEELQQVLASADLKKAWGSQCCESVAKKILDKYDTDGDGVISFSEFQDLMKSTSKETEQRYVKMWQKKKTLEPKDMLAVADMLTARSSSKELEL